MADGGASSPAPRLPPPAWAAVLTIPLIAWSRDIAVVTLVLGTLAMLARAEARAAVRALLATRTGIVAGAFVLWTFVTLLWSPAFPWETWLKTAAILMFGAVTACGLARDLPGGTRPYARAAVLAAVLLLALLAVERATDGALIGLAREDETAFQRLTALSGGLVLLCCTCFPCAVMMSRAAGTILAFPAWVAAVLAVSLSYPMDAEVVAVAAGAGAFLIVLRTGRAGMLVLMTALLAGMAGWGLMAEGAAHAGWHRWLMDNLDPNWGYRVEIWRYASELVRARPLEGYGFDAARELGRTAALLPSFDGKTSFLHPHNGLLQVWLELGLVGVALALLAAASGLNAFLKRAPGRVSLATVTATVVTSAIIWSLSFGVWQGWWLAVLGLTACCAVLAVRGEAEEGRPARTRKRLLFLVTEYYFFHALQAELTAGPRQQGYEIFVAARCGADSPRPAGDGVTVIPFPWKRSPSLLVSLLYVLPDLCRVWRLMATVDPDVLHNIALKSSLVGSLAAMGRRTRVINAIHGFGFLFMDRGLGARLVQRAVGLVFRLSAIANNAVFLTINRHDQDLVHRRMGVPSAHVRLVHGTGIDTARFAPLPEPPQRPFRFLVIGRLLYMKGAHIVLAAHRLLRERGVPAELVMCGAPDPDNPSSIPPDVLADWAAQPGVTFTGQVPDVRPMIASCHVLVLPSLGGEGLPRALSEAAACGRPLIATDIPGNTEVVIPRETGLLVPPGDAAALADAMQWMIAHPIERQAFGRAGRALIERDFASARVAESHAALYGDGLGRISPPENIA